MEDVRAVEPLIAALTDKVPQVREAAVLSLGELGDERAVEPLMAALQDEYIGVRSLAAGALGKIGEDRAVEALIAALQDERWPVRGSVASALGKIGGSQATEALIVILKNRNENDSVRGSAIYGLAEIGESAYEPLFAVLDARDLSFIADHYELFIKMGYPGSEDLLIQVLDKYGDVEMAGVFLNCGNSHLEEAACQWATEHGYQVTTTWSPGGSGPRWGR
jgi:HEAT repeat protein